MSRVFLDRTFGSKRVVEGLRAAGFELEIHQDHFPQDAPDTDWLPVVAERNWVVLTQDKNIRSRPLEREAVRSSGLRLFALTQNNIPSQETIQLLVRAWPEVLRLADEQPRPFIGQIQRTGVVRIVESFLTADKKE